MSFGFDPNAGLISVKVDLWGPNGNDTFTFGLDTGATATVVRVDILAFLGYGLPPASERARLITASAIEFAPRITVQRLAALSQQRSDFGVFAYNLPAEIGVDGMLGLDFLRGLRLTGDFRKGELSLV